MEFFKVNPHILDIHYHRCSEIVDILCLLTHSAKKGTGSAIAFTGMTLLLVLYQSCVGDEEYTFPPSLQAANSRL